MGVNCVNRNSKEFIALQKETDINPLVLAAKISVWQNNNGLDKFPKIEDLNIGLNYSLKAVDILSSDKAEQVFEKGKKNNWDLNKILTELQVPKEQKQIILDKNITDREEIITSLLADNSFVVEVNTATRLTTTVENPFDHTEPMNTDYYSNLAVPGGTNYTENEIATPAIIPNIKGHAQFATDNGIGWFRSDEKLNNSKLITIPQDKQGDFNEPNLPEDEITTSIGELTKTRRVLEVQSDLFQKGRDKEFLTQGLNEITGEYELIKQNQFLQLLNKKNNWVNFFIQSIVQDSAKKGYEKVLFPKGETAAKIEGHQTLEEFKKQKEDRIKQLEEKNNKLLNQEDKFADEIAKISIEAQLAREEYLAEVSQEVKQNNNEINQLKQELERLETEGFGALKPIYNFYENTVTNILKKNYDVNEITDEHGNKWNKVDITNEKNESFLILLKELENKSTENFLELYPIETEEQEIENFYKKNKLILFNNKDSKVTVNEVMVNIRDNYNGHNEFTKNLVDKLIPLLQTSNAKVKFVKENVLVNSDTLMQYNATTNEIQISNDRLADISIETAIESFLHEVVHSVTVSSYLNPTSLDEKMFKSFMDEIFEKYRTLSGYKVGDEVRNDNYGFRNPAEFIAEIMTNESFQDKVKELENGNLWKRFINYIRSLIGLPKNNDYNNIVNSITNIITTSNYTGALNTNSIFETKEKREPKYYDLSNISKKLDKQVNAIKDNLEENIRLYDNIVKRAKDPSKIESYSNKLKELLNNIEEFDDTQQWKGVSIFTEQLYSNLKSLEKKFKEEDFTDKNIESTINLYKKYLQSHSLIKGLTKFVSAAKAEHNLPITKDELNSLSETLRNAEGVYNTLNSDFKAFQKKSFIAKHSNRSNASKVLYDWKQKLEKQFKDLGYTGDMTSWVNEQMVTTHKDEIDNDVKEYVNNLVNSPEFDISFFTKMFVSGINTNSKLVQIFQTLVNKMRENIISRTRKKDLELKTLFDRFIKEKGNKKPSELYRNLLEYDKNGKAYLKGTYSIKLKEAYEESLSKWAEEKDKGIKYKEGSLYKFLQKNTTKNEEGKARPIKKWLTDTSKLSEIEKEVLEEFKNITKTTNKQTFGTQSLITKYLFGEPYYNLPAVTKSDLERVLEGNTKGIVEDKWKDLTSIRTDDVGYDESVTAINGDPIYQIKVNFRGDIDNSQQSLDLFSIYRLESKNGINYEEKHNSEIELTTLVDIAKDKEYYRSSNRIPVLGKFVNRNNTLLKEGSQSETYQKMVSLMESNVYDILHKNAGKIGGLDKNKVVRVLNGWTAGVGMALNEVTAAANVLNGKAQVFLESVAGNYMTKESIAKAEKIYFSRLQENLKDINSPVKTSYVNQLNDMFDTWGTISVSAKQSFIQNNLIKANVNGHSLQFMQESGEHWMQSTLTMALLDNIKVMDSSSKFINKEGKVVSEDKAASLLDMIEMKEGILQVDPKVVYTTRSLGIPYNEGGKEMVNNLIKKKIFDTMGNYDANMQPEAMRHAAGKLMMMYRKYLIPMGIARFRGISYVNTDKMDLKDEQRFFSEALQEYEEGTYATTIRYVWKAMIPAIKKLEYKILSSKWEELSPYEKKNIHKAVTELVITAALLPLLRMAIGAAIDDDDDKFLYFVLLQTRRLESELSAYRNWNEQYRILESPIPSVRMLQSTTSLMGRILNPIEWDEVYKSGARKGELKIRRNVEKLIPVLNARNVTYKEKYEFIVNAAE